jgi:disulfide bond formation protein DsbB
MPLVWMNAGLSGILDCANYERIPGKTMTIPNTRILNFAGFMACSGMMAYALYAEHYLLLDPCPLCVLQRIAVIAMALIFLAVALHDPAGWGRRIYVVLVATAAAAGAGVAGWHVWLQNLPPEEVPGCGPGFGHIIDSFPLSEAFKMIFSGSGECASIDWSFLGLSMPAVVVIGVVTIGAIGVWANTRKTA